MAEPTISENVFYVVATVMLAVAIVYLTGAFWRMGWTEPVDPAEEKRIRHEELVALLLWMIRRSLDEWREES